MYPPADPWGPQEEPTPAEPLVPPVLPTPGPTPMYGRAAVPPVRESTAEYPPVALVPRRVAVGPPRVSWQRAGKASRRTLSDGWGFTAFGLLVLLCGWGVWAAAGGRALAHPLADVAIVLVVGALLFVVLRTMSRYVIEGLMRRNRPHARWSHFFTGVYLTVAGVFYFTHTSWLIQGLDWLREQAQRL